LVGKKKAENRKRMREQRGQRERKRESAWRCIKKIKRAGLLMGK
jgi:hypothetical protein